MWEGGGGGEEVTLGRWSSIHHAAFPGRACRGGSRGRRQGRRGGGNTSANAEWFLWWDMWWERRVGSQAPRCRRPAGRRDAPRALRWGVWVG